MIDTLLGAAVEAAIDPEREWVRVHRARHDHSDDRRPE